MAELSPSDSAVFMQLPVLQPDKELLKAGDLPPVVDNAEQPYFRSIFDQVSNECGQAAAIGMMFTYELNHARNTPANNPENLFPTHYTYNFMNGGFGWHGVSYFHSFEIARINGHPSIADFGYLNECGPSYWMSGYEKYLSGMSNKLEAVYQIPVGTPEGLELLKNWLYDHLGEGEVGGLACFYSSTPWNLTLLPGGTPEGGKHVITGFLQYATHSSTITGYNDSIRYDYNQDGQYTNHLDINNDGKVTMQDWEIGGLRFTDSYLGGVNWADSGFAYMMYKTLADKTGEGGIWNNVVHVIKTNPYYSPKLTMKVKLEHNCRNTVKVLAGISQSAGAQGPEHVMGFPIFDFQGGCQFMQGGWEPEAKSIEFGLDITPLMGHIEPEKTTTIHLLVYERDPNHTGQGKILEYAVVDHLKDLVYPCPAVDVPLNDNGMTILEVDAAFSFDALAIEDQELPVAHTEEVYNHQMTATGGTPPYTWNLVRNYLETSEDGQLPTINETKLSFPDTVHSQTPVALDFSFPFYGESFDSVWVHTDGFIMFDPQPYPWPYLYDEHLMIRKTRNIAPFLNNFLYIDSESDNGVWMEKSSTYTAFRWKMSASFPAGSLVEFALFLYPDGTIEFFHDAGQLTATDTWASGFGMGDGINYHIAEYASVFPGKEGQKSTFTPFPFPEELAISAGGLLSGTPQQNYQGVPLLFHLTDSDGLVRKKELEFQSFYAGMEEQGWNRMFGEVSIRPNPVRQEALLLFELYDKTRFEIGLSDVYGRTSTLAGMAAYDRGKHRIRIVPGLLEDLSPGVYFVQMRQNGKIIYIKKMILVR